MAYADSDVIADMRFFNQQLNEYGHNVLAFTLTPTPGPSLGQGDLQRLAIALAAWWEGTGVYAATPSLSDVVSSEWTYDNVIVRQLAAPKIVYEAGQNGSAGALAGDALPNLMSLAVTHRCLPSGRSYVGRSYVMSATETVNVAQKPTSGYRDDCVNAFEALRVQGGMDASPYIVGVNSRKLSVVTPITVSSADREWDTQRRRGKL